jgi:hypothetical protein
MPNRPKKTKDNSLISTIIILGLILMVAGTYHYLTNSPKTTEELPVFEPKVETPPAPPVVETVVPTIKEQESMSLPTATPPATEKPAEPVIELPLLDESDTRVLASLQQILSFSQYEKLFITQDLLRSFVVFIDNFARGDLVANFSPLTKPGEPFSVTKVEQQIYLNTDSYLRYNIYIELLNSIDIESAMQQYRTLKPLFDEAYQELGYPEEEFSDRLNEAIQLVVATPLIHEPIALVAPSVMYKFADPKLEALPAAQKLLLRMGPDNLLKLKAKLLQIQQALQAL